MVSSLVAPLRATTVVWTVVALAGCSGDPGETADAGPARAAWFVVFLSGPDCVPLPHSAKLGEVSESAVGTLAEDGEGGALVSCSVQGDSTFVVEGTAGTGDQELRISIPALTGHPTRAMPVTGSASFRSADTEGEYTSSDDGCAFWFATGTSERVEPGLLWAAFECPKLVSGDSECTIADSYLVFDGCLR